MSWDERFSNTTSSQYQSAVRNISATLTAALMSDDSTKISSFAAFSKGTMASVQVAQLSKGKNNTIVSFAYGVVYGDETLASLPSYKDIQSKLDSDTKVVNSATVASVSSPSTDPCAYQQPSSTLAPRTTSRMETTPNNLWTSQVTVKTTAPALTTILPRTSPTAKLSSASTRRLTTAARYTSSAVTSNEIVRPRRT
ncbi:hypothetical protein COOONC_19146 [Cooperia oncophora]